MLLTLAIKELSMGKRRWFFLIAAFTALLALPILGFSQAPAITSEPLTNERIMQLVASGIQNGELLRLIGAAPAVNFHLTPSDTDQLQRAGVSMDAIKMMSARESGMVAPDGRLRSAPPNGHPRVFVTDSPNAQSANANFYWGTYSSGSHPQTAEIMKTIGHECANATVTNNRQQANYVLVLERESQKVIRRDNKMVIFNQDGDLVYSESTRALGNAVRNGCAFLK